MVLTIMAIIISSGRPADLHPLPSDSDDDVDDDTDDDVDDDAGDDDTDAGDNDNNHLQWPSSRFAPPAKGRRGPEVGNHDV